MGKAKDNAKSKLSWLAMLYLFLSTLVLFAVHMPAFIYLLFKVSWPWGRLFFLSSGLLFVLSLRNLKISRAIGICYFCLAIIYTLGVAYLLSAFSLFIVLTIVVASILIGISAKKRFWAAGTISILALAAIAFKSSLLIGVGIVAVFASLLPRRLLGYFSPVSIALLVASAGLHLFAVQFFKARSEPVFNEELSNLKIDLSSLLPKTRIRFVEKAGQDKWILGLRESDALVVEWDDKEKKVVATFNGSGDSSDNAAVNLESGVIYFGDYQLGCVHAVTLDGLRYKNSKCYQGLRPTFLALDNANGVLYVASDFSEQMLALDSETFDVIERFSCKGGIHHFCKFQDGRIAAVSGLGKIYIFEPRLKNPKILDEALGFFIFHIVCDSKRDAVYVDSFASGFLNGFDTSGRHLFRKWYGPALRYMAAREDLLAVSNYFSGRIYLINLERQKELKSVKAVFGITQLKFMEGDEILAISGKGVYQVKF